MKPKVYIDKEFFLKLDEFKSRFIFDEFSENSEILNFQKLKNILNKSIVNCELTKQEIISFYKKNASGQFKPENWFEVIISNSLRNEKLEVKELNFNTTRSIYFLNKNKEEIYEINERFNVLCEGIDYDFSHFFGINTTASVLVDKKMNGIEKIHHCTKNVLLIDPYIFNDGSKTLEPKIPNLAKLLIKLFSDNHSMVCNLGVITNNENNELKIKNKIEELSRLLNMPNLTVSVFAHKDKLFEQNRYLITDYCIMDLQHIFDRDNGSISVNFIFEKEINENYLRIETLLNKIIKEYKNTPQKIGNQINKFGDLLNNGIFKDLV